jgi:UDP-glucose 4-epimerase
MAEEKQAPVKRNLLVTGGMGFIGSHTIVEILNTED